VSGSVAGQVFSVRDTIGLYNAGNASLQPYSGVVLANSTGTCALFQSGLTSPPSTQLLVIQIYGTGSTVPGPGSYAYGATNGTELVIQYAASDADCNLTTSETATGGSVTLETVTAAAITGTFDVTFAGGDHVSGAFDGPVCDFVLSALVSNGSGCVAREQ
jgi:hypothetical protein